MPDIRCIFCLEIKPSSEEHLFAEPVGRVKSAVVLCVCVDCNSALGTDVDVAADRDEVLSTARHLVGLPLRPSSVASIDPVTVGDESLRMRVGPRSSLPELSPQKFGDEVIAGEEDIPRVVREGTAKRIRQAGLPVPNVELDRWIDELRTEFRAAPVGGAIQGTFMGLTVTLPKMELEAKVTVHRRAEPGATDRLVTKIGLEAVALALGPDVALAPGFDSARRFARYGEPLPWPVRTVSRPNLLQPDAIREHRVCLQNHRGHLRAIVTLLGSYRRRVTMGPSVGGLESTWERVYTIDANARS